MSMRNTLLGAKNNLFFYPEEEYHRSVIGKFPEGVCEDLLADYAELAAGYPALSVTKISGGYAVIDLPEVCSRADFMNLVEWMNQNGNKAYGIAEHKRNSYVVMQNMRNPDGGTVLVGFDSNMAGVWQLSVGFCDSKAAFAPVDRKTLPVLSEFSGGVKGFLAYLGLEEV